MTDRVPHLNARLQGFGTTIFATMSALAVETGSINLGQGFPDTDGPPELLDAAAAAIRDGHNQYPPGRGIPELRRAVADHQRRFHGLRYDPDREVLVTAGATEAIAAALLSLCEVGDEVVTFEPYYDSYAAGIAMAGAQRRVVTLRPPDWSFDHQRLVDAITPRTRLILLNSPHNPTGKVFGPAELELIAALCNEHDLVAVTDEVYEHLVFDGSHVPLATYPGMRDRTVTVSSAGKAFNCTGWKVGWACASPPLLDAVTTAKQFLTYVNAGPFQYAVAAALALPDDYYERLAADLATQRDLLCEGLAAAGFEVFRPSATYFAITDVRPLGFDDGVDFCLALPERCGVVAVPAVVFHDDAEAGRPLVRFAFCKRPDVLEEAVARLGRLAGA